jgi:uncharacterized surface protein with fasciclin (FAS1) repeats
MQIDPTYKRSFRHQSSVLFLLIICLLFGYCAEEPLYWKLRPDEQNVGDYIANNPDQFSEFAKLMELTNLKAVLNVRGPYTVMVPTNEAMIEYYKEKKVNSLTDFSDATRQSLIRNHIYTSLQGTDRIGLGTIRDTNALGDYMTSEFKDADTYLNKNAKIIKKDIRINNGIIHVLDKVLDPVTKDIYTLVSENPAYTIFSEGLRLTGLKDTLQIISFQGINRLVRTRYTLFAVPDTIYHHFGIHNVNELINWCGASPENLSSKENPFYRYIEYHCLIGTFYLNFILWSENYPVLSGENYVSFADTDDYKINFDTITNKFTGFIIPASNITAKNGVIHTVNDLLPVFYPGPKDISFDVTEYPDLQQQGCYQHYYMKWTDGQNSFEKIKFQGDYLQYIYSTNMIRGVLNEADCLSMEGFWWIEITTPYIIKGRYDFWLFVLYGASDYPHFDVYIDGIKVKEIDAVIGFDRNICEVNWLTSCEHKIKLVCTVQGRLFWDGIQLKVLGNN